MKSNVVIQYKQVYNEYKDIIISKDVQKHFSLTFYGTSIWDETLYSAWTNIVK